jgi:hypothetical protein
MKERASKLLNKWRDAPPGVAEALWFGRCGKRLSDEDVVRSLTTLVDVLNDALGDLRYDSRKRSPRREVVDAVRATLNAAGFETSARERGPLVEVLQIVLHAAGDLVDARDAVRTNSLRTESAGDSDENYHLS